MFELNRKWHTRRKGIVEGSFSASNLSMSLLFPEDTIITGKLTIHFFISDLWILDYALYGFSLIVIFMIFSTFSFILMIGCLRLCIDWWGGEVPDCFKICIRPIVRGYDHYVKKKVILEMSFSSSDVLYAQTDCSICLEPFAESEQIAILRCHHVFHTGCISEWVNKKDDKSIRCPVCKHDLREKKLGESARGEQTVEMVATEDSPDRDEKTEGTESREAEEIRDRGGRRENESMATEDSVMDLIEQDMDKAE